MTKSIIQQAAGLYERKYKNSQVYFNTQKIYAFGRNFLELLYPQLCNKNFRSPLEIENQLEFIKVSLSEILTNIQLKRKDVDLDNKEICQEFLERMEDIEQSIDQDAQALFDGDPAAFSLDEVITCYPGFKAVAYYRIAHEFYKMNIPIFPRILSEYAHQITGVDIHPGAKIGSHFYLDHGTGVVIGETCVIGNSVKVYQGVTLGALSVDKNLQNVKRHPTIEDNVIIYSNATILGGETVIGEGSVVGGNCWIMNSIPPHSLVYRNSDVKLKSK